MGGKRGERVGRGVSGWVWQLLTGTSCQFYRLEGTCSAIPEARFPYYSSFASTDGYGYLTADVMYNLCVSPCKVCFLLQSR